MIDLNNEKIAEILHYHIMHESLDKFIIDPVLAPYEDNEEIIDILANAIHVTGAKYFVQGYLLGKSK